MFCYFLTLHNLLACPNLFSTIQLTVFISLMLSSLSPAYTTLPLFLNLSPLSLSLPLLLSLAHSALSASAVLSCTVCLVLWGQGRAALSGAELV